MLAYIVKVTDRVHHITSTVKVSFQNRLFEQFMQVDKVIKLKVIKTEVGMTIIKHIIVKAGEQGSYSRTSYNIS